ncbi:GyrI-like domain-containing protein [Raoultibacter phocaeensis]|uniref:GyrI-like domain-containing protein n=1 Tax=Raoultibacter phocaeensis TaxID=2479841 RepID=UPI00111AC7DD|nr:GyrI-like domain-containing protein [Raoultibacter phocaeensis]
MEYTIVELPERRVVGPVIRTSNGAPDCSEKIGGLWQAFMGNGMAESVPDAVTEPYTCFGLYYDYAMDDETYAMMVGCESSGEPVPETMEELVIPAGTYAKFTVHGDCVNTVVQAWNEIWAMEDLTARRAWTVDFEAYPAMEDENDTDIDLYIALAK